MFSLELQNRGMSTALKQLQLENSQQSSLITDLKQENSQQSSLITNLQKENSQQSSQITGLQQKLAKVDETSRHVETGKLYCDEGDFPNGGSTRSKTCDVSFSRAYDSPPAVIASPVYVNTIHGGDDTSYRIEVQSITTTGFTLYTKAMDNSKLDDLEIMWMSVAK